MTIVRYTCSKCGLLTRVAAGESYIACACSAAYSEEVEGALEGAPDEGGA